MSAVAKMPRRRRVTVRLKLSAEEHKYVKRLLLHLRRPSGVAVAIRKLLQEPTTTPRKETPCRPQP